MVGSCSSRPCQAHKMCHQSGKSSYVCEDISLLTCNIDQQIENGKILTNAPDENKFLDKAMFQCDNGYIASQHEVKCKASGEWQAATCTEMERLSDCKEILDKYPTARNGLYEIELWKSGQILTVNCDMETADGGWTVTMTTSLYISI
ncbi:uncharacterized protein LOC132714975 [Ruditapes philippinarum]|uniref:uncharacterized protein LOC132714975 n=1 Tax=Ruditapes philippinarum TaxID=129788 RepID=UPI00295A5C38|nr:uncharacterized protein LOC132714975 [Ruditapes philippinarum]